MTNYTSNTHVTVYPFTRQEEGEEVVIGRLDTAIFLVLPRDAVELLDYLIEGKTVGEAQSLYKQRYGEIPDLSDLLDNLECQGFVQPLKRQIEESQVLSRTTNRTSRSKSVAVNFHFTNFPQPLARKIFSYHTLLSSGVLIGLALIALIIEPSIVPGWDALFFRENLTLMRLILSLIGYLTLFLHEMAHLVSARAMGVSSRLGISNRMWFLVAETDMTGVWSIPRSQRYLPFLAGSLLDAVSASILILIFFAQNYGWLVLCPFVFQLGRATLLIYIMRLFWQCFLFMRTDFYFVIANFFGCRNLMKDTEAFLWNQITRFWQWARPVDQSHIPVAEMQVVRWYALFWILGRIAALGSLVFISIPLLWNYCSQVLTVLSVGYQANPYAFIDAFLMTMLVLGPDSAGFLLWIRSFRTSLR